jgi:predicted metal-binding membrane protein
VFVWSVSFRADEGESFNETASLWSPPRGSNGVVVGLHRLSCMGHAAFGEGALLHVQLLMFTMWVIMMAAMMVPSAAPVILIFAAVNRKRREQERPFVPTGIFLLGYLVVWGGFSAVVTVLQWRLHETALLTPMMASASPLLSGATLMAAGIFS